MRNRRDTTRRAGFYSTLDGSGSADEVRVYARGINPDRPQDMVAAKQADHYPAFKPKIGFGEPCDLDNIRAVRALPAARTDLMLDANQAWSLTIARHMVGHLNARAPAWLEEPLRADRPVSDWQQLASATRIPLAAGENLIACEAFETVIGGGALGVVQPDLAKWGGVSGCPPVVQLIHQAGLRYRPLTSVALASGFPHPPMSWLPEDALAA